MNETVDQPGNVLCGCPFTDKRRNFHIIFFIFSFIIPISVLVFCYASVYCEVVTVQQGLSRVGNETSGGKGPFINKKKYRRKVENGLKINQGLRGIR